ncbi:prepilin peptidase-dependent protein [Atlantibacter sp.]|uniref:prepilin peptidase-dependent protein n=1 Tax=Atlantibacter sp. TaxID=1903473 RepID=UPI0028A6FC60|nr:prepilin peptidase-dependent protein [Atlantibacter sp.]
MKIRTDGFTLMEMMVVMVIVTALAGAGMYSWRDWQQQQQLREAAIQLRDFLTFLREDANWHNRDHLLWARQGGKGWCVGSKTEDQTTCETRSAWHIVMPSPDVQLLDITPGLGFFGLRNTAWPGHIRLRNDSGEWRIIVSAWGRIRACNISTGAAC